MPCSWSANRAALSLGESVRALLLDAGAADGPIAPRADALLFNAARAQLVDGADPPGPRGGTTVICSRFADSTLAYQGVRHGPPARRPRGAAAIRDRRAQPDLTMLLDLPGRDRPRPQDAARRRASSPTSTSRSTGASATASWPSRPPNPSRFVTVDATAGPIRVRRIAVAVRDRLGPVAGSPAVAPAPVRRRRE